MNNRKTAIVHLELKYCERCGALGLRTAGSESPFCAACSRVLTGLSPNRRLATHVHFQRLVKDAGHTDTEGVKA